MKLVKALGALALPGIALGVAQLAAAEDTVPVQELAIVEETASPTLADARIPPDDIPYRGDLRPYRPFRPYGHFVPYRPFRPYGHFVPHRPFRPFRPFDPYDGRLGDRGRSEAAPAWGCPMPAVSLQDHR
ncbi:hypothetical protein [Sorangium sp. So ce385]|uniref:hypothetical protein n=1 Tax=Sorangium sp. So ce385 TaxID=3133308 RepID=UPI003F5AEA66